MFHISKKESNFAVLKLLSEGLLRSAGQTGMKAIVNQAIFTLKQRKPGFTYNQMQIAGFPAN